MKTWIISLSIAATFFVCSSAGCQHDSAIDNVTPATSGTGSGTGTGTGANPTSGRWIVSYFNDRGTVMTEHLAGYVFDFKSDGVLAVNTGAQTINGTWHIQPDDSRQEFIITLPGADAMLAELQEDWDVVANAATELDLHNGSGNSGHVMDVHFTKQ